MLAGMHEDFPESHRLKRLADGRGLDELRPRTHHSDDGEGLLRAGHYAAAASAS